MVIYESRKKELANALGENGCVKTDTWMKGIVSDINGELRLYPDDMKFLRSDAGSYCVPGEDETEEEEKSGVMISTTGVLKADVTLNGVIIGKTDTTIEMEPGEYIVTLIASGYDALDVSFMVYKNKITAKSATMKKTVVEEDEEETEETGEVEIAQPVGAVIRPTMNVKGTTLSEISKGDNAFGFEFTNVGDTTWWGRVGVRIYGTNDTILFETYGSEARQNIKKGETKYLWAYVTINELNGTPTKISALLTT